MLYKPKHLTPMAKDKTNDQTWLIIDIAVSGVVRIEEKEKAKIEK